MAHHYIQVEVVHTKQGNLFSVDGIYSDVLPAFVDFAGGSLMVMRKGVIIQRTVSIKPYNLLVPSVCFVFVAEDVSEEAKLEIRADAYQVGDDIILEFDTSQDFRLSLAIRFMCYFFHYMYYISVTMWNRVAKEELIDLSSCSPEEFVQFIITKVPEVESKIKPGLFIFHPESRGQ